MSRPLKVAVALGGGGARGLAHIVALEALDEAGVKPVAMAGTSIGAIIGAAYAAGVPAADLRRHAIRTFRDRTEVMAKLFKARTGRFADLFAGGRLGNPVLMDGERLLAEFWPAGLPQSFEALPIPLSVVAADYYGRTRVAMSAGALRAAVAASMAIPGLLQPVKSDGRVLVDGGAVDPVPFDELPLDADLILAIDVTGGPVSLMETEDGAEGRLPSPMEVTLGASQIMQSAIFEGRLLRARLQNPSLELHVLRPAVESFNAMDFFAVRKILAAAEPLRAEIATLIAAKAAAR
ncbi:MAG: patatin-like phospholipase family protein [Beijerinckiaceae bacterium]|nr:patatin-like phospholipase family protein [Beijerinckiaceae bacterium]